MEVECGGHSRDHRSCRCREGSSLEPSEGAHDPPAWLILLPPELGDDTVLVLVSFWYF